MKYLLFIGASYNILVLITQRLVMTAAQAPELNFESEFEVVDDTSLDSDPYMNPRRIDMVTDKAAAAINATSAYVVEKTSAACAAAGATGTYVAEKTSAACAAAGATGTYVAEKTSAACAAAGATGTYVAEKTSAAAKDAFPVACAVTSVGCQFALIGTGAGLAAMNFGLAAVNFGGSALMETLEKVEEVANRYAQRRTSE